VLVFLVLDISVFFVIVNYPQAASVIIRSSFSLAALAGVAHHLWRVSPNPRLALGHKDLHRIVTKLGPFYDPKFISDCLQIL